MRGEKDGARKRERERLHTFLQEWCSEYSHPGERMCGMHVLACVCAPLPVI